MKIRLSLAIATLVAVTALPTLASAQDDAPEIIRHAYRGELIDQEFSPISGVFPMVFKLYAAQNGTTAVWTEEQFVAVYEGRYDVVLGAFEPLPAELNNESLFIAMEIAGAGEVTRHPVTVFDMGEPVEEQINVDMQQITFADIADRAIFAQDAAEAENCRTLGGKTLDEIDRYEELLGSINEVRSSAGSSQGGGAALGSRTTTLGRIGGAGGNPYTETCPPGYVVTGARGGHGNLIDSLQFICSPLE